MVGAGQVCATAALAKQTIIINAVSSASVRLMKSLQRSDQAAVDRSIFTF